MSIKLHVCNTTDDNGQPHLPDVATCGSCRRSWCFRCCPTPASLCPFCNGDDARGKANQIGKRQLVQIEIRQRELHNLATKGHT